MDNVLVDFHTAVLHYPGQVRRQCLPMPQECARQQPCRNGICRNGWQKYFCDCRNMPFRGDRCEMGELTFAVELLWKSVGALSFTYFFRNAVQYPKQCLHRYSFKQLPAHTKSQVRGWRYIWIQPYRKTRQIIFSPRKVWQSLWK